MSEQMKLGVFLSILAEEFDKKMRVKGSRFVYQKQNTTGELSFIVGDLVEKLYIEQEPEHSTGESVKEIQGAAKMLFNKMEESLKAK